MKTRLTFSAEVWAQIIRRWGSEDWHAVRTKGTDDDS